MGRHPCMRPVSANPQWKRRFALIAADLDKIYSRVTTCKVAHGTASIMSTGQAVVCEVAEHLTPETNTFHMTVCSIYWNQCIAFAIDCDTNKSLPLGSSLRPTLRWGMDANSQTSPFRLRRSYQGQLCLLLRSLFLFCCSLSDFVPGYRAAKQKTGLIQIPAKLCGGDAQTKACIFEVTFRGFYRCRTYLLADSVCTATDQIALIAEECLEAKGRQQSDVLMLTTHSEPQSKFNLICARSDIQK